ncbi:integrase core domain-containing protein [Algihabitans sp.]
MADARRRINDWKEDYKEARLHSALGNLTPSAFAALLRPARKVV